ncbi:hypothetical protein MNB_SV-9-585 [hydrothermal vent metagenome]|uniref:Uncharacterized protein n=1 Tax=hydrothermal vent metagenome TaxID=652676 RepID=A0A1W1BV46_9ZZZZ
MSPENRVILNNPENKKNVNLVHFICVAISLLNITGTNKLNKSRTKNILTITEW